MIIIAATAFDALFARLSHALRERRALRSPMRGGSGAT
jgi:hypothetical protein